MNRCLYVLARSQRLEEQGMHLLGIWDLAGWETAWDIDWHYRLRKDTHSTQKDFWLDEMIIHG